MAKPFDRLPFRPARKRSSHELPPDDLSDFERPPLPKRRTTLQDWFEAPRTLDPFARFTDEPIDLFSDHEALKIERLAKRLA